MKPTELIPRFDAFLAERGLALEAIATGGAALALLGIIHRETRDCDLIEPELSPAILDASRAFAAGLREELDLGDCLALAPSAEELGRSEAWIAAQDQHPDWPAHVRATFEDLARRLGHGL